MSVYSLAILCDIHVCEYEACLRYDKCPYRTSKHLHCPIYSFTPIVKGTTLSCGTGTIPPVLLLVSRTTKASRWSRHMCHRIRHTLAISLCNESGLKMGYLTGVDMVIICPMQQEGDRLLGARIWRFPSASSNSSPIHIHTILTHSDP